MTCPKCGSQQFKVLDTYDINGGRQHRRRRICLDCGEKWWTAEFYEKDYKELVAYLKGVK